MNDTENAQQVPPQQVRRRFDDVDHAELGRPLADVAVCSGDPSERKHHEETRTLPFETFYSVPEGRRLLDDDRATTDVEVSDHQKVQEYLTAPYQVPQHHKIPYQRARQEPEQLVSFTLGPEPTNQEPENWDRGPELTNEDPNQVEAPYQVVGPTNTPYPINDHVPEYVESLGFDQEQTHQVPGRLDRGPHSTNQDRERMVEPYRIDGPVSYPFPMIRQVPERSESGLTNQVQVDSGRGTEPTNQDPEQVEAPLRDAASTNNRHEMIYRVPEHFKSSSIDPELTNQDVGQMEAPYGADGPLGYPHQMIHQVPGPLGSFNLDPELTNQHQEQIDLPYRVIEPSNNPYEMNHDVPEYMGSFNLDPELTNQHQEQIDLPYRVVEPSNIPYEMIHDVPERLESFGRDPKLPNQVPENLNLGSESSNQDREQMETPHRMDGASSYSYQLIGQAPESLESSNFDQKFTDQDPQSVGIGPESANQDQEKMEALYQVIGREGNRNPVISQVPDPLESFNADSDVSDPENHSPMAYTFDEPENPALPLAYLVPEVIHYEPEATNHDVPVRFVPDGWRLAKNLRSMPPQLVGQVHHQRRPNTAVPVPEFVQFHRPGPVPEPVRPEDQQFSYQRPLAQPPWPYRRRPGEANPFDRPTIRSANEREPNQGADSMDSIKKGTQNFYGPRPFVEPQLANQLNNEGARLYRPTVPEFVPKPSALVREESAPVDRRPDESHSGTDPEENPSVVFQQIQKEPKNSLYRQWPQVFDQQRPYEGHGFYQPTVPEFVPEPSEIVGEEPPLLYERPGTANFNEPIREPDSGLVYQPEHWESVGEQPPPVHQRPEAGNEKEPIRESYSEDHQEGDPPEAVEGEPQPIQQPPNQEQPVADYRQGHRVIVPEYVPKVARPLPRQRPVPASQNGLAAAAELGTACPRHCSPVAAVGRARQVVEVRPGPPTPPVFQSGFRPMVRYSQPDSTTPGRLVNVGG